MARVWNRIRKVIAKLSTKKPKKIKESKGEWVTHKGEDLGTIEINLTSSEEGQRKGIKLSNDCHK